MDLSLSQFSGLPPHNEQTPFGLRPPQEPERGLLLNITPIAIPPIAINNMLIPNIVSMPEFKENSHFIYLYNVGFRVPFYRRIIVILKLPFNGS